MKNKINFAIFLVFLYIQHIQSRTMLWKAYLKPVVFLQQNKENENKEKESTTSIVHRF